MSPHITKSLFDLNRIDSLGPWSAERDRRVDSHGSRRFFCSWRDQDECQSVLPCSTQTMLTEWNTVCRAESSAQNTWHSYVPSNAISLLEV